MRKRRALLFWLSAHGYYSLVDLVVVAEETGLLDITLDKILASSCTLDFEAELPADAEVSIALTLQGEVYARDLVIERY